MKAFQPGSNRERIYNVLNTNPMTIDEIVSKTGIEKSPVQSVLGQIGQTGHVLTVKMDNGQRGYVRGKGDKEKEEKEEKKDVSIRKKIDIYLIANVGNAITLQDIVSALKLKSTAFPRVILNKYTDSNHLERLSTNPTQWRILHPINKDVPQQQIAVPEQQYIPDINNMTGMSDAIGHFMQMEQQNVMFRQALQQVVMVYMQLGNILDAAGLLEPE